MAVELCGGVIEFYGDGRWFCLECDYQCDEPGNADFGHAVFRTPKQRANDRLEAAFSILERTDMPIGDIWKFLDGKLCDIAAARGVTQWD